MAPPPPPGPLPDFAFTGRKLGTAVLGFVLCVVGVIMLEPFTFAVPARVTVTWWDNWFDPVANVVLFLPLGVLLALLLPPRRRWVAVPVLATASVLVELVQHVALPRRFATGWDVLANTTGAVLGVVLVVVSMALLRRRAAPDPGPVTVPVGRLGTSQR